MQKLREIITYVYPKATSAEMRSLTANVDRFINEEKNSVCQKRKYTVLRLRSCF